MSNAVKVKANMGHAPFDPLPDPMVRSGCRILYSSHPAPMTHVDILAKLTALKDEIRRHDNLYYAKDRPKISDTKYDRLFRELIDLERQHPELVTPDSPTQRVGAPPLESLIKVPHEHLMLSLDPVLDQEEVQAFDQRMKRELETQAI
ncbi:MAG: hypothetical protein ITD35_03115 [Nitrospira sp.]|nr:hypothetical protein [Nitrospira sp.]